VIEWNIETRGDVSYRKDSPLLSGEAENAHGQQGVDGRRRPVVTARLLPRCRHRSRRASQRLSHLGSGKRPKTESEKNAPD
jgi:hypothetical protein